MINPKKGFEEFRTRTETAEKNAIRKALDAATICLMSPSYGYPNPTFGSGTAWLLVGNDVAEWLPECPFRLLPSSVHTEPDFG